MRTKSPDDGGEPVSLAEPLVISRENRQRGALSDLALDLVEESGRLRDGLPTPIAKAIGATMRSINCYYSNLIEGHDTHPIDIEKALHEDYSSDPRKRDLQLEASAHINTQAWIDAGGLSEGEFSASAIKEIHRRFYSELPDTLRHVTNPATGESLEVIAGEYRHHHVLVGRHAPISPGAIPRFMERFERAYSGLGRLDRILAAASAHHRLAWIHPFADGNGRVARLMSHAVFTQSVGSTGLWSVARGLARRVDDYKEHLAQCDSARRGDLDGRGNLSEDALAKFTGFFLETAIDQACYMREVLDPKNLRARVMVWAKEEVQAKRLAEQSLMILELVLLKGEIHRGEVARFVGSTSRHGRRLAEPLEKMGILVSSGTRAPYTLDFPASIAHRWLPGVFPEKITKKLSDSMDEVRRGTIKSAKT